MSSSCQRRIPKGQDLVATSRDRFGGQPCMGVVYQIIDLDSTAKTASFAACASVKRGHYASSSLQTFHECAFGAEGSFFWRVLPCKSLYSSHFPLVRAFLFFIIFLLPGFINPYCPVYRFVPVAPGVRKYPFHYKALLSGVVMYLYHTGRLNLHQLSYFLRRVPRFAR